MENHSPPLSSEEQFVSKKSYAKAVILGGGLGIFGLHFFYLERYAYGCFDLGLSIVALYLLATGEMVAGLILLGIDFIHSLFVTFRLLTGMEVDGEGKRILYPGQKLRSGLG